MTGGLPRAPAALAFAMRTAPLAATATAGLGALSGAGAAPAAWLLRDLLNQATERATSSTHLVGLAAGASAFAAASTACAYLGGLFETQLAGRVRYATQTKLAAACASHIGTAFLDDPAQQEELNRARRGAHEAPPALASLLVTTLSGVAAVGAFAVMLAISWPWMFGVVLLTSLPLAAIQRRVSRAAVLASRQSATSYRWADYFSDLLTEPPAARESRLFGTSETVRSRHADHLLLATRAEAQERTYGARAQVVFTLLAGIVSAGGAAVMALAVARRDATAGDFVLFTTAVAALQRVTVSLISSAGMASVAASAYGAFEEFVRRAERETVHDSDLPDAPPLHDAIVFDNVAFRYPGASAPALESFTARFAVGCSYALVGDNGSGKTTILRLLLRFYEPEQGAILWDGIDIRTYSAASLRARMSGVMQDYIRYELSVSENVVMGLTRGADRQATVDEALGLVGMSRAVERLAHGPQTLLSSTRLDESKRRGAYLSGGQWQRIAVARALAKAPVDVMLLDEADASLDEGSSEALVNLLQAATRDRSAKVTIFISHDPVMIEHADHVVRVSPIATAAGARSCDSRDPSCWAAS